MKEPRLNPLTPSGDLTNRLLNRRRRAPPIPTHNGLAHKKEDACEQAKLKWPIGTGGGIHNVLIPVKHDPMSFSKTAQKWKGLWARPKASPWANTQKNTRMQNPPHLYIPRGNYTKGQLYQKPRPRMQ